MNRIVNLFLLLLGIESLTVLIKDTFGLLFPHIGFLWIALLCTALWISAAFRKGILAGMPICALILWYLYQYESSDLLAELRDLVDCVGTTYFRNFSSQGDSLFFTPQAASHMTALVFLVFLIAAFTTVAMHASGFRITLTLLGTMPFVAICIAVNGSPSPFVMLCLAIFWFGLFLGGDVYHPSNASGKAAVLGLLPCSILLAMLLLVFRPSTYTPEERDFSLSRRFDRIGNTLSDILDGEANPISLLVQAIEGSSSALNGWETSNGNLDLTRPYDHSVRNHEIIHLTTDLSGSIYLRSRSFGEYTGTSWLLPAEDTRTDALSVVGQSLSFSGDSIKHAFSLTTDQVYETLFLPYFSITGVGSDVQVLSNALTSYSGDFYLPAGNSTFPTMADSTRQTLAAYQEFVHRYYTRLPDSTANALRDICLQNGLSVDRQDILTAVADFVRKGSVYDTSIPSWQTDDYAVYFLSTARRGYCIHYATSACALFRALQIPARVTEGFLMNVAAGEYNTATGADAHAWVEVWLDDIGWYPVEVTRATIPVEMEMDSDHTPEDAGHDTPTASPNEQYDADAPQTEQTPSDGEISSSEDGTGITEQNAVSSNEPGEGDLTGSSDTGGESSQPSIPPEESSEDDADAGVIIRTVFRTLAIIFLSAGFPLVCILSRYLLVRKVRENRIRSGVPAKQVIEVFLQAEHAIRHSGQDNLFIPEAIRIPAERAFFSDHVIAPEEAQKSLESFDTLKESIWADLNRWKRILFRFIHCDY